MILKLVDYKFFVILFNSQLEIIILCHHFTRSEQGIDQNLPDGMLFDLLKIWSLKKVISAF